MYKLLFLCLGACSVPGVYAPPTGSPDGGNVVYISGEACTVNNHKQSHGLEAVTYEQYLAGLEYCKRAWWEDHQKQ